MTVPFRHKRAWLLLVLLLGAMLRIGLFSYYHSHPQHFDHRYVPDSWDTLAKNIIAHHSFSFAEDGATPTIARTPPYALFLAGLSLMTGGNLPAMRLLYLVLDTLFILAVVRFGYFAARSEPAALWAGLVYALTPLTAWYCIKLSPDAFISWIVVAHLFLCMRSFARTPRRPAAFSLVVLAGLFAGFACLTKNLLLPLTMCLLLLAAVSHRFNRRFLLAALIYLSALASVLSPWLYRNYRIAGTPAPLHSLTWLVYWYGEYVDEHTEGLGAPGFNDSANRYIAGLVGESGTVPIYALDAASDLARERTLRRLAFQRIGNDPGHFLAKSSRNLLRFWYLTETRRLVAITRLFAVCISALFIAGMALLLGSNRRHELAYLVLAILYFNIAHAPFFAIIRYLVPVLPFICVFAGYALYAGTKALRGIPKNR